MQCRRSCESYVFRPEDVYKRQLITIVLMMQGQLDTLNENIEWLIEQVRIANSYRLGKHTVTLNSIDGQMSFFYVAESCCDLSVPEPAAEEDVYKRQGSSCMCPTVCVCHSRQFFVQQMILLQTVRDQNSFVVPA